jgi:hypothetical protein
MIFGGRGGGRGRKGRGYNFKFGSIRRRERTSNNFEKDK